MNESMEVKLSIQGVMIYLTMGFYLVSLVFRALKKKRESDVLFFAGFVIALASVVYRWVSAGHLPMQNLFEVFVCLGMLVYPISVLCRRGFGIEQTWADILIGLVVLFPAGFVFKEQVGHLPPALQSWLFGPHGKNFVRTIVELAQERDALTVVSDQVGRPTFCRHLAELSLGLVLHGARGTFHVANTGRCSWYELAKEIIRLAGIACDVQPCPTSQFPRPAPRPHYSVLDLSQTAILLGPIPEWRAALRTCIDLMQQGDGETERHIAAPVSSLTTTTTCCPTTSSDL
jgi:uncharacterized membrane protein YqaE (UPF0057 family)